VAKEILIADSDKAEQEEFKKIFEATDYNLVFSESGQHALLRVKLLKPDLIIAGASLKEKSGFDVCKAIKADPEFKHIPVILLSNIFKEVSEDERKRVRADGVITKPFHEDEILNLVDRLIEEGEMGETKEKLTGKEKEWRSIPDIGKAAPRKEEGLRLDEIREGEEEEIIDLVDVVEEPELKMSIDDFIAPEKETRLTGITPLESWEKMIEEEKPVDRKLKFGPDEKELKAKGRPLQLGEEVMPSGEISEKELFEKIELEEILQKVEQLAPSIEKEWPPELRKAPIEPTAELVMPTIEEPPEKYAGLAEFEAALKKGIGAEPMERETQPPYVEEPTREVPKKVAPAKPPAEKAIEEELKEVEEEALEVLEEKELEVLDEKELRALEEQALKEFEGEKVEEVEEEGLEILEEKELRALEEQALRGLEGEELKEVEEEALEEEEISEPFFEEIKEKEVRGIEEVIEEGIKIFEEVEAPEVEKEKIPIIEKPEEERIELFEEIEAPEIPREEVVALEKPEVERIELFEEIEAPKIPAEEVRMVEKPTAPILRREEMIPRPLAMERQVEEVISKGAREMMEGFITKLVPEITQSIINLTIDRIERMVREIVPDLAEKMIQEEIKRLQKGEEE